MFENKDSKSFGKELMKRYIKVGLEGLTEKEVLELLLVLSTNRLDVRPIAYSLLHEYKELWKLHEVPIDELIKTQGMNIRSAILLRAIRDYLKYYLRMKVRNKTS